MSTPGGGNAATCAKVLHPASCEEPPFRLATRLTAQQFSTAAPRARLDLKPHELTSDTPQVSITG